MLEVSDDLTLLYPVYCKSIVLNAALYYDSCLRLMTVSGSRDLGLSVDVDDCWISQRKVGLIALGECL